MTSPDPDQWMRRALCRTEGHPSDWDDAVDSAADRVEPVKERKARIERAKAVCARCPVKLACALNTDPWKESGVWFGVHLERWRKDQQDIDQRNWQTKNYEVLDIGRWSA